MFLLAPPNVLGRDDQPAFVTLITFRFGLFLLGHGFSFSNIVIKFIFLIIAQFVFFYKYLSSTGVAIRHSWGEIVRVTI